MTLVRESDDFAAVAAQYPQYRFDWASAEALSTDAYAWVHVGATHGRAQGVYVRALVDVTRGRIAFVQHTTFKKRGLDRLVEIRFGESEIAWTGVLDPEGNLRPAKGSEDPKVLLEQNPATAGLNTTTPTTGFSTLGWCEDVISNVCQISAGLDSAIACAMLGSLTGPWTGLGCGVVLVLISWWGCRRATRIICG
ncbi:hypothetical protein DV701_00280 [Ornithinimicrobium avium]|uniref:Uncharacterized protein n=1 Tax=Ornithinimicrobium avium TaxID=2283195 RepID=A0A345NIG9_9MICO|nr:hypothetical protein DV701_00280 [Ornithinimicrobium avium]